MRTPEPDALPIVESDVFFAAGLRQTMSCFAEIMDTEKAQHPRDKSHNDLPFVSSHPEALVEILRERNFPSRVLILDDSLGIKRPDIALQVVLAQDIDVIRRVSLDDHLAFLLAEKVPYESLLQKHAASNGDEETGILDD